MASRRKPWWGAGPYETFRQKVVQRFTNFDLDAMNHVIGRNQAVAQVLCYLNLLYNAGRIASGSRVIPSRARWQSLGGSRVEGTEGVHCLPCQVLVVQPGKADADAIDPSDLPGLSQAVREGIRTEFGHPTLLPAVFNSADVVAEQCRPTGLRGVFAGTCQRVISGPRRSRETQLFYRPNDTSRMGELRDVWLLDREAVREAYRDWVNQAEAVYRGAMDEVERGRLPHYLGPLHRSAEPALVMEVLNAYLKHHRAATPTKLRDDQMGALERTFNG